MRTLTTALMIALATPAMAVDLSNVQVDSMDWNAMEANARAAISKDPAPVSPPANTGGWAACSYGVCNGYNNNGSSWWSSNAGGTIQYFYNQ